VSVTTAEKSIREGRVTEALAELQAEVKRNPADARLRVFLFQLLCVLGQWERAATQLKVVADLDSKALEMVRTYEAVLACEQARARVFAGQATPIVFGEPTAWMAGLVQALTLTASGKHAEASALRSRAFEDAPAVGGRVDEVPFAWIADADSRLGPVLEAIVNGRYYWIPFTRVRELRFEKPTDLRDVAWTPASLTLANGGETVALVPTRYPASEAAGEPSIVLGRATTWKDLGSGTFVGLGQRVFATDEGEHAIMDIRHLQLDLPEA
jgi:type VI secretion system protein ImpE